MLTNEKYIYVYLFLLLLLEDVNKKKKKKKKKKKRFPSILEGHDDDYDIFFGVTCLLNL